ncbi:DUF4272 domain-containing protein [Chitinolyticbacter albus]|uniref:DUF4272 domain-containing protein n=1 Tax=Chitinolyticbacter albus TaxID=2961951 RepID=UPI002109524D|nr:DUF4272 domain-containing protein [Chitinolyticbacter albus]
MSPESRKASSESKLRALGIPINEHLPLIETEEETKVRSRDEVFHRLLALWAVVGKAFLGSGSHFAGYIAEQGMQDWLSGQERDFLFSKEASERDQIHFSWQLEAFFFIAWAAGLVEASEIPTEESSVQSILGLFPQENEAPDILRGSICIRSKSDILDRADLMYRLHWAVRNAHLTGSATPKGINGGVVQEWHRAVNWMTCYGEENDWDQVGTDT